MKKKNEAKIASLLVSKRQILGLNKIILNICVLRAMEINKN